MPTASSSERRRVTLEQGGPALIEGPAEIVGEDGSVVRSDRFLVALCRCKRSAIYPLCDTSHRRRARRTED
ncbi:CDGSH iron-sulfur domain-containing protein [Nocardia sp. NPDC050697]|uniref:CDGSH iron-sulfur domain-containing protein n=1 Tax=Nocardia sp. NPDC050697 TaxID=3155158 RepID=UPI0033D63D7C